jgi:hypothetical protein
MKKYGVLIIALMITGGMLNAMSANKVADLSGSDQQDTVFNMRVGSRNLNVLEDLEGNKKVEFPKNNENEPTPAEGNIREKTLQQDTLTFSESEGINKDSLSSGDENDWKDGDRIGKEWKSVERDGKEWKEVERDRKEWREQDNYRNDRWSRYDNDYNNRPGRFTSHRFHGHWSALEVGLNNYTTSINDMSLPGDIDYMALHSGKSLNFNLNFTQLSIGLCRWMGFVTGLGVDWNNYRFDGNNNIAKDLNGQIVMLDPNGILKKSKFSTIYATAPLLFEIQIPVTSNTLRVSGGVIGGVKIASHTKMVYDNDEKVKSSGDLNLNMFRWGYTARAGYGNLQVFGTYYATPLFQKGKGPGGVDLFPFEIGIALTFQD